MKNEQFKMKNFISILLILTFTLPIFAQKISKSEKSLNAKIANVYMPSQSPLISMRIQFLTGSVDDPQGKEGLASLTAAMIADGGTKNLTYDQIVTQFYPMAAGFGWQVD